MMIQAFPIFPIALYIKLQDKLTEKNKTNRYVFKQIKKYLYFDYSICFMLK